jgi:hypothetical protein
LIDKCGNPAADQVQVITVKDNTAPTFTRPADATIYTDANCAYNASVSVTGDVTNEADNCSTGLQATFSDVVTAGSCAGSKIITRTWSLIDKCGNPAVNQVQIITVLDNIKPTAIAQDITVTLGANNQVVITPAMINNGSFDNCSAVTLSLDKTTFNCSNVNSANTVILTVTDACGNSSTANANVTVLNPAPVVGPLTLSSSSTVVPINSTVTFVGSFSDNNISSAVITWDDGTSSTISSSPFTINHTYTVTGVNTVELKVTDGCGLFTTVKYEFVVVYDPSGGFVTGGGWINSPLNAYANDPLLTGRANFGFVSKYLKGANVPTGNTEFQFQVGNLNFKSTSYQWLVVSCSKAQYKGSGTINGAGDYGFLITALDGSPDKFRIKIWDKATSNTVYDNQMGSSEDSNAATDIAGGSIVVHDTRCKTNARVGESDDTETDALVEELAVETYPNPMNSSLTLHIGNPNNEPVSIRLVDVAGRSVIMHDSAPAADGMYKFDTANLQSGLYILRVKVGTYAKTLKVVKE